MSYDRRVTVSDTLTVAHNEALSGVSGDLRGLTVVGLLLDGWNAA